MSYINYFFWIALIIAAITFVLSGIDDLIFDLIYWPRFLFKSVRKKHYHKLSYEDLLAIPEKK